MKSIVFIASFWTLAVGAFTASLNSSAKNATLSADEFVADGIMLHEVVISSLPTCPLPTCPLPEIFVRPADSTDLMPEFTLPEVVITGQKMPEFTLPEVVISAKKTRA